VRVELARAHLLYGEWLRRERRRLDAREQLRTGHDMFASMGSGAFRAARRAGVAGDRRSARANAPSRRARTLPPRRRRWRGSPVTGCRTLRFGARLFISPRTVEYQLHQVFSELGINSRNQLELALPRDPSTAVAV
jgi:hypothetical protein